MCAIKFGIRSDKEYNIDEFYREKKGMKIVDWVEQKKALPRDSYTFQIESRIK